jgi:hypothetical protein
MATNPKLPDRDNRELRVHLRENAPKSGAPWVPVALIVAAVLLIALIAFLPRAPKVSPTPSGAEVPPQPTGSQVQLSNVRLAPSPDGKTVAVDALLNNAGGTTINGIAVDGKFTGEDGRVLATIRTKVMGIEGNTAGDTQDLTQGPIKPNDQRPVRMVFEGVPDGWNHQPPALTVAMVTGSGTPEQANGAKAAPDQNSSATPATPSPK